LCADFVKHKFDVQYLIRTIMNSRTYQVSATPNESNAEDEINFSHVVPHRLLAEQILDSAAQLTGSNLKFEGLPDGTRAAQLPGVGSLQRRDRAAGSEDSFLLVFGKPPRLVSSECERSNETTMGQAFQLISGPLLNNLLTRENNRIDKLIKAGKTDEQILDELFWTAVSRAPTKEEAARTLAHLKENKERRKGFEDVVWALMNAKEFVMRY
jgi:hypothetical protein